MTIDEALILLRRDHVEEDIKALTAKDRLTFWAGLEEFARPKMQRTGYLQDVELPTKIEIEIIK